MLSTYHIGESGVDPAARINRIETADDQLELTVPILIFILNLAEMSVIKKECQ